MLCASGPGFEKASRIPHVCGLLAVLQTRRILASTPTSQAAVVQDLHRSLAEITSQLLRAEQAAEASAAAVAKLQGEVAGEV
jgi:hypothetical protein